MPRQLRNKGGITNVMPRKKYGIGSDLKDFVRKVIPNELADVAVKAAPFVAPFNPAVAGLMRGIGRFDQRGSLSDAFKQGLGTYAGGQLFRTVGGAGPQEGLGGFKFSSPLSPDRTTAVKDFFSPTKKSSFDAVKEDETFVDRIATKAKGATKTKDVGITSIRDATGLFKDTPILKDLPSIVQQQILVGGVSGAATYIYEAFLKEEPPQEEGETYEEYMARRKENVGRKMKGYFDNYFKFDKEYSSMTDEQKQAFIDRVNVKDGGRIKYQTGGITMANTLAENIARNRAAQAAFQQSIAPAQERVREQIRKRTPVQEYAMGEDSILGPLSKKAASTIMEGQDKSQAALDVLNQTMAPTRTTDTDTDTGIMTQAPTTRPTMADVAGPSTSNNLLSLFERYKDIQTPAGADPNNPDFVGETALGNIEKGVKNFLQSDIGLKYGKDIPSDINDIYASIEAQRKAFSPDLSQNYQGGDLYYYLQNFYRDKYGLGPTILNPGMAKGGMPTGIMKTNKAGVMERDYRDKGGFVPVGIKEKADDVPAMLSKNEFVMTADAVRGAGNGSIEKGAQRMYDTMKNLEKRVV